MRYLDDGPDQMSETTQILIDERTAANRLSVSVATLSRLRKKGAIPFRRVLNRVLYDPDALREWAARDGMLEGRAAGEPIGSR